VSLSRPCLALIVAAFAATIALPPVLALEAAEDRRIVVEIHKLRFDPPAPALRLGDIVVWRNQDIVPHTATSRDGSFDSGTIEAGAEWESAITEAMQGAYYCRFHPSMTATLALDRE